MPIKVLIVDDSALIRQLLTEMISADAAFEVVGTAADPFVAREKIKQLRPDVLTLDVEMPRMDGLTFLENLMRLHPLPVLMVSSLTERGAEVTLQALDLGAVDFVTKPKLDVKNGLTEQAEQLRAQLKAVARARLPSLPRPPVSALPARKLYGTTDKLIAIGSSTGGTEAVREVIQRMPADAPAIVITQHIPATFSAPFAPQRSSRAANGGGRAVPQRRPVRRPQRRRCGAHRHGRGRSARPAGGAEGRRPHAGAGRGQQRGLGHAGRGVPAGCGRGGGAARPHRRGTAAPARWCRRSAALKNRRCPADTDPEPVKAPPCSVRLPRRS